MDTDESDIERTAKRMVSMYKNNQYTPEQRATDHAFAYESTDAGRKFWIGVLQQIYRINHGDCT